MLVEYIRSSSYSNWEFCQMQYFITYVLGYTGPSGQKAELGTIVHKVMECLANLKKAEQDLTGRKAKLSFVDDAVGLVEVNKSKLRTDAFVDTLIERSKEHYIKDSVHKWQPRHSREIKELTYKILAWSKGMFDPRNRDVLYPEPHFDITIDEPWAEFEGKDTDGKPVKGKLSIKGTIDLVTTVDDDTIEVIDWKTGQRKNWATGAVKDLDALAKDPQLLLYFYAISHMFPQYKNAIMTIFFVRDGGPFSLCFDTSDHDRFLDMLRKRFETIKNSTNPTVLPYRDHATKPNWKCSRLCHFYKNNWPGTETRMCNHVQNTINTKGMDHAVKNLTKDGFSVGYYSAPG